MANSPQMEVAAVESTTTSQAPGGNSSGASAAVQAAVDDLLDGAGAPSAEVGQPIDPSPAPAAAEPASPQPELEELQAFARAQDQWARSRSKLEQQAKSAKDDAKREVLVALQSDDPDGQLEALGLSVEQRRAIVRRMILRHVPADKANEALRVEIEKDQLQQQIKALQQRVDKQDTDRVREREEAQRAQAAQQALSTLHEAFQSAGDDGKFARARYGKRRDVAVQDAIAVGKELMARGEISARMTNADISRRIVQRLDEQYRDEFALGSSSPAAAPTPTPPRAAPPTQQAAEARAARTITRGQVAVTRQDPAPAQRSEAEELDDMAQEFAKLRRDGKLA